MNNFADRLLDAIDQKKSYAVVGLDPRFEHLPEFLKKEKAEQYGYTLEAIAESFWEFNRRIIDAVADDAPAVKPQIAFYEQYGHHGMLAYQKTVSYAKEKGLIVIADAKRGDIGTTAEAYSKAFIGRVASWQGEEEVFGADSITVNPYLGYDGIEPFIKDANKYGNGLFVLVKTSNKSSIDLQDMVSHGKKVFRIMGELVTQWSEGTYGKRGYSSVGAVVGATYPKDAQILREVMPKTIFLVPGYGAQGGTAEDVKVCFNADGYGAIVNSSRDIIFAFRKNTWKTQFKEEEFDLAAKAAVQAMNKEINSVIRG